MPGIEGTMVHFDQEELKLILHDWHTSFERRCDDDDRTPITPDGATLARSTKGTQESSEGFEEEVDRARASRISRQHRAQCLPWYPLQEVHISRVQRAH